MWKGPHHGFVKRLLTHQHCAHRSRNQNWVVNPEWKRQNPGSGWVRNHADSKKGGGGVNVRDKTCSKNWDAEKNKNAASLGISLPRESGQLESWYFHLGASNGISVGGFLFTTLPIKNLEEEDPPRSTWYKFFKARGGPLPPGSWLGNIVHRKTPPLGGFFRSSVWWWLLLLSLLEK